MLWLLIGILWAEETEPIDDLDAFLAEIEMTAPSNQYFGMGALSGASPSSIWESRFRYRDSDRLEAGFEETNPNLHGYTEFVNRYYYKVNHPEDNWTFSIQIDEVNLGLNKYILDDELLRSWSLYDSTIYSPFTDVLIIPEKISFTKDYANSKWDIGDMGGVFGRGIALSIRSNKVVDVDTSLRGLKYTGNFGRAEITMLSGLTNKQQISKYNPNFGLTQDISHMVSGTQLMLYGLGMTQVGVHHMVASFGRAKDREDPAIFRYDDPISASVTGADIEIFGLGGIDWYFEGDLFQYKADELSDFGEVPLGYTGYSSASMYPGSWVVLVEGKVSKDSERINRFTSIDNWEIATPPSLEYERMITEDSSATVNSNDVYGVQIRADYPLRPAVLTPYVSVSVLRDTDVAGLHFNTVPETIVHPTTGIHYSENGKVLLMNAGYRIDQRDDSAVHGQDRLAHFDGEISFPLFGQEGLEISPSIWKFWWGENPSLHNDFMTLQNAVVWRHGEFWDFTWYQDYTTNTQLDSTGNITENLYMAGEVSWKPKANQSLKLLAGAYKAGIRCSGGQCRTLPGFNGAELAYSTNF